MFSKFAGETFAELLKIVDIADPNENHRTIIALADQGYVSGVITTNFDTLIEHTGSVKNTKISIVAPGIFRSHSDDVCALIKLHGTTVDTQTITETSTHKAKEIDPTIRNAWLKRIDGNDLLVLGYSGADISFGIVKEFFSDFLKQGKNIYWAHRTQKPPKLPKWIQERVTFFEGSLPFPLCDIREALKISDFKTPQYNQDANTKLAYIMDKWSRELHIGPWSAAVFYLNLAIRSGQKGKEIVEKLFQIAKDEAGKEFVSENFVARAIFLPAAAIAAQSIFLLDDAELFQKATIKAHENHEEKFNKIGSNIDFHSYQEHHSNIAKAWNNLALTQMMKNNRGAGLNSFSNALYEAYLSDNLYSFLIALLNNLVYKLFLSDVCRCMQIAESALRLSDRFGLVVISIEFRLLLARCAHSRNELKLASEFLHKAKSSAKEHNKKNHLIRINLYLGENELRSGKIDSGLMRIAKAIDGEKMALFGLSIESLQSYLQLLGIDQPTMNVVTLSARSIGKYANKIKNIRKKAHDCQQIPWKGAHCAVYKSVADSDDTRYALYQLGLYEFEREHNLAIELGLKYAEVSLSRGNYFEARWSARNVLLRPQLKGKDRAKSHSLIARAASSLGLFGEVRNHLEVARNEYRKIGGELPSMLTYTGMWFYVQCEDVAEAVRWAKYRVASINHTPILELQQDSIKLFLWGESMFNVANIIQSYLEKVGKCFFKPDSAIQYPPWMFLRPLSSTTPQCANEEVATIIQQAEDALQQSDSESALVLIDDLLSKQVSSEYQLGHIISLRLQAMIHSFPFKEFKAFAAFQCKRLVQEFKFTALSLVEVSLIYILELTQIT